jgi:hypothetical protein
MIGGAVVSGISSDYRARRASTLDDPRNADSYAVYGLYTLRGQTPVAVDPEVGLTPEQRGMVDAMRAAQVPVYDISRLPPPTQSAGSRPVSSYEQAQNAAFAAYRDNLVAQIQVEQQLLAFYERTNEPEAAAQVRQALDGTTGVLRDTNQVLSAAQTYNGRAFDDESAARSYVEARERLAVFVAAEGANSGGATLMQSLTSETDGARVFAQQNAELRSAMSRVNDTEQAVHRASDHIAVTQNLRGDLRVDGAQLADTLRATTARYGSTGGATPSASGAGSNAGAPRAGSNAGGAAGQALGDAANRVTAGASSGSSSPDATEAAAGAAQHAFDQTADALDQPEPVPTHPDYPTVSAEERARISREAAERRRAQQEAANAAAGAERAAQEAAAREAAERAAMVERARINDENHRLFLAAQRQAAQDNLWAQLVRERFGNGAWDAFADGQTVTVLQLESIYAGYDPMRAVPPAMSLSSAGNSLSAVGWSLSLAGLDYRDPAVESLNEILYGLTTRLHSPFDIYDQGDPARAAQEAYNAGPFDVRYNRDGRESLESGGYLAANLFDNEDAYLRWLTANGLSGLDALLAQPFNVILTWGANANDLDLHMTGPLGASTNSRFHIYYSAPGDLQNQPYAQLIKDCICSSGSEVILTSALNRGGVYRVSVFNFGDQSAGSSNLSNASEAKIQIVRGGKTQSAGNGTTIVGGKTILTTTVPNGGQGNTWTAVELDPKNGRITVPRRIKQSPNSSSVD